MWKSWWRRPEVSSFGSDQTSAEGSGAGGRAGGWSRGSAAELETLLLLASDVGLAVAETTSPVRDQLGVIRRMLSALMRSLRSKG
jgi:four helix bundle protein